MRVQTFPQMTQGVGGQAVALCINRQRNNSHLSRHTSVSVTCCATEVVSRSDEYTEQKIRSVPDVQQGQTAPICFECSSSLRPTSVTALTGIPRSVNAEFNEQNALFRPTRYGMCSSTVPIYTRPILSHPIQTTVLAHGGPPHPVPFGQECSTFNRTSSWLT